MDTLSSHSGASRREFIRTVAATVIGTGCGGAVLAGEHSAHGDKPMTHLSATQIAKRIAEGQVSALEVAEECLKRIKEVNPKLKAIVQEDPDRVRAEARQADKELQRGVNRGPLHGVPFTMKDSILTKVIITTNGCLELKDYKPKEDATVVKRLKRAGGILLGKTNVPEMCYQSISDNLVYGRTNNPYDLSRTPGGSSGGEAAIIAACGSPFGLGTDIGDSIRAPAHLCGIAGIKPTCRLVPESGVLSTFPLTFYDWNSVGPMARHVEDLELVLRIIAGPDGQDPYVAPFTLGMSCDVSMKSLRIAVCLDDGNSTPSEETRRAVEKATDALRKAGVTVVEKRPPNIDKAPDIWAYKIVPLWINAANHAIESYSRLTGSQIAKPRHFSTELTLKWLEMWHSEVDFGPDRRHEWLVRLQNYREEMMRFMSSNDYDALLSPVAKKPAGPHPDPNAPLGTSALKAWESFKVETGAFCMVHNLTGWPAAVVRGGTSPEGLPIAVQIAEKPWREDVTFAVAGVIEKRLGGWQPPGNL